MKNFSKIAVVTAALALVAQGAKAQVGNPEDLILGITDSGTTVDYVVDLGQASTIVGQSSVVTLSGDVTGSTFNSNFGSTLSDITAGVVGGSSSSSGLSYMTTVRSSAGVASSSNGSLTPQQYSSANSGTMSASTGKSIGNTAESIDLGVVSSSDGTISNPNTSWTKDMIGFAESAASYDPNTSISGTVYEDLWSTHNTGAVATYLGYFTFNFSNSSSPVVTFTGANVAVPEPATYGFLAGAGLLVVALRRQFAKA